VIGLRRALLGLGVLGLLLMAVGVAISLSSAHLEHRALDAAISALLMTATGFAAFGPALTPADTPLLFSLGMALGTLYLVVAVHMLLVGPRRDPQAIVAGGYALSVLGPTGWLLFTPDCGCGPATRPSALTIADVPALTRAIDVATSVLGTSIFTKLGPRARRPDLPVELSGS
jgi:hypothetical protein